MGRKAESPERFSFITKNKEGAFMGLLSVSCYNAREISHKAETYAPSEPRVHIRCSPQGNNRGA